MEFDKVGYLETFNIDVRNTYEEDKMLEYQYQNMVGKTIDDWLFDRGTEAMNNTQHYTLTEMIIEIRYFSSFNGMAKKHSIDISDPGKSFGELIERYKATDIVSVEGKSILKCKTRMDVFILGPEYYLVKDDVVKEIKVKPEFDIKIYDVMKIFVDWFLRNLSSKIASEVVSIKSEIESKKMYAKLGSFLTKIFTETLDTTIIGSKVNGKKYQPDDILKMFKKQVMITSDLKSFKTKLIGNFKRTYGTLIFHWFDDLPRIWEKELYPPKIRRKLGEKKEYHFLKNDINKMFKNNYDNNYKEFISICNGGGHQFIPEDKIRKKKFVPLGRKIIFKDLKSPCGFCFKMKCKDEKYGNSPGIILKYKNSTFHCPEKLFDNKMNNDKEFRTVMTKIATNLSKTKNKNNHIRLIIAKNNETFNLKKHYISIPVTELEKNKTIKKTISNFKTKEGINYQMVGNSLMNDQNHYASVVEYQNNNYPNVVFLLDVNK